MEVVFKEPGEYKDGQAKIFEVTKTDVKAGIVFDLQDSKSIQTYVKQGYCLIQCMLNLGDGYNGIPKRVVVYRNKPMKRRV